MANASSLKPPGPARVAISREALLLAGYAEIDPRTAERALRGELPKWGRLRERVERALREHPELRQKVA